MVKASLMVKTDFELLCSLPCPPCFLMSVVGAFLVLGLALGILKIHSLHHYCSTALCGIYMN